MKNNPYPSAKDFQLKKYEANIEEKIRQGKRQFSLGIYAAVNELVQNAIEALAEFIWVILDDDWIKVRNDGNEPITEKAIKEIWWQKKLNELGQFDEATKLILTFMRNDTLWITTSANPSFRSWIMHPLGWHRYSSEYKLPPNVRTEVAGRLNATLDIDALKSFLSAIHGLNLHNNKYKISIGKNRLGNIFPDSLPKPIEIPNKRFKKYYGTKLKIYIWTRKSLEKWEEWKKKCPYNYPSGIYLANKGIIVTWRPLWGTEGEPYFAIIDDVEGKIFRKLVTNNKQVVDEKAPQLDNLHYKIWNKVKPSRDIPVLFEEMEKNLTDLVNRLAFGGGDGNKTGRNQNYLWKCNDCGHEWLRSSRYGKEPCPKCGSLNVKYIVDRPNQPNPHERNYEVIFIKRPNYRKTSFIGIKNVKIFRVNSEDPMFDIFKGEFQKSRGVKRETLMRFVDLIAFVKQSQISESELKEKEKLLIKADRELRNYLHSRIKRVILELRRRNENRKWFKDYVKK